MIQKNTFAAGIDAGSRAVKILLMDAVTLEVIGTETAPQTVRQDEKSRELFTALVKKSGLEPGDVKKITATGYARKSVSIATDSVTEITCHARGVHHLAPKTASVIEIGGQDSKFIRLDENGKVADFTMNDRCAAGTGRFLEMAARQLEFGLDDFGEAVSNAPAPAAISSMCVVFAETEIIGLLADGEKPENIAAGVMNAVAARVAGMIGQGLEPPVVFTGGVAKIPGMRKALSRAFDRKIDTVSMPQMTGALGAALIAAERLGRS